MDLWILNQSKDYLVKVNALYIVEHTYEYKDYYYIEDEKYRYAAYTTKERALEVLDEIQSILKPKGIIKLDGMYKPKDIERIREKYNSKHYFIADNEIETIQMPETIVYEMPEE